MRTKTFKDKNFEFLECGITGLIRLPNGKAIWFGIRLSADFKYSDIEETFKDLGTHIEIMLQPRQYWGK